MIIKISNRENLYCEIDEQDFDLLKNHNPNVTLCHNDCGVTMWSCVLKKAIQISRLILNVTDELIYVDHADRNNLNCKRNNIREATFSQNKANSKLYKNNELQIKNIRIEKRNNTFHVRITKNKKQYSFGCYKQLEEAIKVRDEKSRELHKEFSTF